MEIRKKCQIVPLINKPELMSIPRLKNSIMELKLLMAQDSAPCLCDHQTMIYKLENELSDRVE